MEILTVEITNTQIIIRDGRMKGSRLKWQAPGLEIYQLGACPVTKRDKVQYCVMQACLSRHIPLISLKSYGWV